MNVALLAAFVPLLFVTEKAVVGYAPDGTRIELPAGTEIDACAAVDGNVFRYDIPSRSIRLLESCKERPLFADGFEQ